MSGLREQWILKQPSINEIQEQNHSQSEQTITEASQSENENIQEQSDSSQNQNENSWNQENNDLKKLQKLSLIRPKANQEQMIEFSRKHAVYPGMPLSYQFVNELLTNQIDVDNDQNNTNLNFDDELVHFYRNSLDVQQINIADNNFQLIVWKGAQQSCLNISFIKIYQQKLIFSNPLLNIDLNQHQISEDDIQVSKIYQLQILKHQADLDVSNHQGNLCFQILIKTNYQIFLFEIQIEIIINTNSIDVKNNSLKSKKLQIWQIEFENSIKIDFTGPNNLKQISQFCIRYTDISHELYMMSSYGSSFYRLFINESAQNQIQPIKQFFTLDVEKQEALMRNIFPNIKNPYIQDMHYFSPVQIQEGNQYPYLICCNFFAIFMIDCLNQESILIHTQNLNEGDYSFSKIHLVKQIIQLHSVIAVVDDDYIKFIKINGIGKNMQADTLIKINHYLQEIQLFVDIDIYFQQNFQIQELFTQFQKENDYEIFFNQFNLKTETQKDDDKIRIGCMSTGFNQGNYVLTCRIDKDRIKNPENDEMLTQQMINRILQPPVTDSKPYLVQTLSQYNILSEVRGFKLIKCDSQYMMLHSDNLGSLSISSLEDSKINIEITNLNSEKQISVQELLSKNQDCLGLEIGIQKLLNNEQNMASSQIKNGKIIDYNTTYDELDCVSIFNQLAKQS